MSDNAKQLFDDALRLSDSDRSDLAAWLIASLDSSIDDGVEAAWSEEIAHRISDLDSGQVSTIPWHQARKIITGQADET
jgi:putative addiction module component (TIGR02574 family)